MRLVMIPFGRDALRLLLCREEEQTEMKNNYEQDFMATRSATIRSDWWCFAIFLVLVEVFSDVNEPVEIGVNVF